MLEKLFRKQKALLDHFFDQIDLKSCEALLTTFLQCRGVLFFSGIGKSGFIAQKIAATMMSTGTKAFYLSAIDALHGDLGMVSQNDVVVLLSKSGETEELLQLLPSLRNKGSKTVALSSNAQSRLVKGADQNVILPLEHELCPFDLAPTTSTQAQLLLGDVLAIALMERKNFSLANYAENHPHGQIGRRASTKVRDLMLSQENTPICHPHSRLKEVLVEFTDKRCGCLIVVDHERQLKGIFTDGDLRRALQQKGEKVLEEKIQDIMTRCPKAIHDDAPAWDAVKLMEADQKHPVMVLPVLEREKSSVIGIIKMHDLIQAGL
ncbi:MAG: SIS domain-containing protein [Chlamydiales bacterium]